VDPVIPGVMNPDAALPRVVAAAHVSVNDAERSWLEWLVKVRIIVITFLLGIGLAVTRLTPTTNVPVRPFVSVILLWYTISVFFTFLLKLWPEHRLQARLQILTDVAFATWIIYCTGGIDTWFNFLYPLIIIVASVLLPRIWAYATGLLSFIAFGAMLELSYFDIIHSYSTTKVDAKSLQAVIFINLIAYLLVAYLATTLSNKLRQADVELAVKQGALEGLQALHENIIDSMSGGLITTDLNGRIKLLNISGQKLLEISAAAALGMPVTNLFLDKLPTVGARAGHGEVRCLTPNGHEKTFAVSVSALSVPDRGEIGYVYALEDLTQVRRLEQEVRMRDRLAAIGRLASGIAHEIRNPLSSIAGSVQVLSSIAELNEEERSLVDIVVRESDRLNAIISDFLLYARDKSCKLAVVNLVPLLDDTLHLLTQKGGDEVRVIRDLRTDNAWAAIDPERIRQVFCNVGERALRAMKDGGKLTVSLRGVAEQWHISFADTARGITGQHMEKFFEPFQDTEDGTGLGMAIVYQIMQAHSAQISARLLPSGGTEIVLGFKQAAKQAEPQPDMQAGDASGAPKAVAHG
jgi:two-component system, NtrC family, sensor histidine kinase PilS